MDESSSHGLSTLEMGLIFLHLFNRNDVNLSRIPHMSADGGGVVRCSDASHDTTNCCKSMFYCQTDHPLIARNMNDCAYMKTCITDNGLVFNPS